MRTSLLPALLLLLPSAQACTNGTTLPSLLSNLYETYCNIDFPGNDLTTYPSLTDLPTCIDLCDAWNVHNASDTGICIGVAAVQPGANNEGCFLKSSMPGVGGRNVYVVNSARRIRTVDVSPLSRALKPSVRLLLVCGGRVFPLVVYGGVLFCWVCGMRCGA